MPSRHASGVGCLVCGHPRRVEIEAAAGEPGVDLLDIAVRFGVTATGLGRHVTRHPRAEATAASPAPAAAVPPTLRPAPATPHRRSPARRAPTPVTVASSPPATPRPATPPPSAPPAAANDDQAEDSSPATSRSEDLIRSTRTATTAREKVEKLVDSLQRVLTRIENDKTATLSMQLAALKLMTAPIRLLGTFTGEIGASETRVASSPFYVRTRKAILEALKKHPAAARDVIAALERLERGQDEDAAGASAEATAA